MSDYIAEILGRDPTYGGAVNAAGLTSNLGIHPAQLAAKEAAKTGAANFGLGNLLQGLGPAYTFYSVLDSLGFFDNSMEATPMTPEERELSNAAEKANMAIDLAQRAFTGDGDTEGFAPEAYLYDAYEAVSALPDSDLEFFGATKNQLLDDLETQTAQNMLLGLTPGQAAGSVLNTRIPGVTDIPGMGPLFEGAMDKVAETIDGVLGYIGMGDIRGDAVFGPGGASIKFEPKTTKRTPTQGGVSPQGTSGSPNGSTATATTGSRQGDIILNGGTVGDVLGTEMGGEGGYSAVEILHDTIALTCKSNETYDRATFSCIPQSGSTQAAKIICPTGYENAGDEVDSLADCGEKTSTATTTTKKTTKTCWDGSEIAETEACPPSKTCWDGSEIAADADCPPEEVKCPLDSDKPGVLIPEGETEATFCYIGTPQPECPLDSDKPGVLIPEGETEATFCYIGTPQPECPLDSDKPGVLIPEGETEATFCYISTPQPECPLDSDKPGVLIPEGETEATFCYIGTQPECPLDSDLPGQLVPYGQTVESYCYNTIDCIDCNCPAYAAEHPEECGVDPDLCNNIAYALLNPEICNGGGFDSMGMPSSSGRTVSVGPAELVNLSSPYDIGGESIFNPRSGGQQSPYLTAKSGGMIETYDEFDELERYLRG